VPARSAVPKKAGATSDSPDRSLISRIGRGLKKLVTRAPDSRH